MSYYSQIKTMRAAQANFDARMPEDDICPGCGREATCDCICDGTTAEVIDDEEE